MKLQKNIDKIMKKHKRDDIEKVIAFSIMGAVAGIVSASILIAIEKKNNNGLLDNKFIKGIIKHEKIQDIKSNLKRIEKELIKTKEALLAG